MLTNITHTFSSDLDITLTSPAGTVVTVTTDNGGLNDNVFNGTEWYDTANPFGVAPYANNNGLVQDHLYVNNVVATPLVPEEGFDAFRGENPNGTWTLTVSDDANQDGGSLNSWSITIATSAALPTVNPVAVFAANPAITIPTTVPPNVFTSTINVAGLTGPVDDVDVVLNIPHTFPGDLDITLQAPSGKSVTITTDNGGTADNAFAGSLFDTDADPDGVAPYATNANHVGDHPYAIGALATPLTLEESAAAFRGEQPNGNWIMTVSDDAGGDGGTWTNWELRIQTNTCPLPSAAGVEISGRVMTAAGNGLVNAKVSLTDQAGTKLQTVVTGEGGFYRFTGVEVGRTYIISVGSRRYVFEPRVIQVFDSIADADFTSIR
jgi:subtilisin-like proprotein convertase family protein